MASGAVARMLLLIGAPAATHTKATSLSSLRLAIAACLVLRPSLAVVPMGLVARPWSRKGSPYLVLTGISFIRTLIASRLCGYLLP